MKLVFVSFAVLLGTNLANAANVEQLQKYDTNKNMKLDQDEAFLYLLHKASPVLAKYDSNPPDGKLNNIELAKLYAEAEETRMSAVGLTNEADLLDEIDLTGGIPLQDLADKPNPAKVKPCDAQTGLYIRRDKADVSIYTASIDKSIAKGASLSFTHDNQSNADAATIKGVATYVMKRDPCVERGKKKPVEEALLSGYAIAPFLSLDGKLSEDKSEKSALRAGLDTQFSVLGGTIFDNQYLTLSPYFQSDFELNASIFGASATWEPYYLDARLGGSYTQFSPAFDFFWQLRMEADAMTVEDAGLTGLKENADYAWLGGTVSVNSYLFPNHFEDRFYMVNQLKYFWDAVGQKDILHYSTELGLNLTEDGSTSISIEYESGREKETLEKKDQILLNLNYRL
jgi:hypothetical protein